MGRITDKQAERAMRLLAEACGAKLLDDVMARSKRGLAEPKREGAWLLDHNSAYGGYVIAAITASSPPREGEDPTQFYTAETHPLWEERCSGQEFVDRCHAARQAIAYKARKRRGRA